MHESAQCRHLTEGAVSLQDAALLQNAMPAPLTACKLSRPHSMCAASEGLQGNAGGSCTTPCTDKREQAISHALHGQAADRHVAGHQVPQTPSQRRMTARCTCTVICTCSGSSILLAGSARRHKPTWASITVQEQVRETLLCAGISISHSAETGQRRVIVQAWHITWGGFSAGVPCQVAHQAKVALNMPKYR